ncbi:MAG: preprotein translocase subunit YajC [Proteobacteria bacterium]|nr:preprotein translocase subunit YajC [Pseudomonadota bacterium]
MSFLINDALATATTAATTAPVAESPMGSILMMVGFILIIYFLLWRPQSKRQKEHRELVSNLSKGDEVITSGGLVGKITDIADDFITVSIAANVNVTVQRSAVLTLVPKGTLKAIEQPS